MSEREDYAQQVRRMSTSDLISVIASHEALLVVDKLVCKLTSLPPSHHGAISDALIIPLRRELDRRVPPSEAGS